MRYTIIELEHFMGAPQVLVEDYEYILVIWSCIKEMVVVAVNKTSSAEPS